MTSGELHGAPNHEHNPEGLTGSTERDLGNAPIDDATPQSMFPQTFEARAADGDPEFADYADRPERAAEYDRYRVEALKAKNQS